jgi:protease-4
MSAGSIVDASIIDDGLQNVTVVRALGMGNAFTAIGSGEGAMIFNPAGLSLKGGRYSLQWLDYKDRNYDTYLMHSFYAQPFGYSYWKMKDHNKNYLTVNAVGYGQKGSQSIDWGLSIKRVSGEVSGVETAGWSSDLGVLIHFLPFMDVGVVGHDIVTNDLDISPTWVTGLALFTPKRRLIVATDFYHHNSSLQARYGIEYMITNGLTARGGWYEDTFTAGAGIILPFGEIEYGVTLPQDSSKSSMHMLSFKLGRGTEVDEFRKHYSVFKPKSYAIVNLGGGTVEGKTEVSLLGGKKIGTNDLIQLIRFARDDQSCKGFILRISRFQGYLSALGVVDEIRQELQKAQSMDKEIIVYIDHWATLPEYYMASIADKIYMPELGTISHLGIEIEIQKTGQFLSNFGIGNTSIASGAFKDRLHSETKTLSLYEKHELEVLVDDLYHYVLNKIRNSRGLSNDVVDQIFKGQWITASEAKDMGLIDEFIYWSSLSDVVKDKNKKSLPQQPLIAYQPPPTTLTTFSLFNRIAVIEIDGPIMPGAHKSNLFYGGKITGANDIDKSVELIRKQPTIRGVIVRINSPGGSILATDQIYRAIGRLRDEGKLVYVSMGSMAASGGYYISLNSDKVFANPITMLGSIGVFSSYRNYEDLYDVVEIEHDVVKTGEYMSIGKSRKALTKKELTMVQQHQDLSYQQFVNKLIKHRGLSESEAYDVAQGQVFLGKTGKKLLLIDELGSFQDTIDSLSQALNISDPKLIMYRTQPKWQIPRGMLNGMVSPFKGVFQKLNSLVNPLNSRTHAGISSGI